MFGGPMSFDRISILREMIAHYEDELGRERDRLDQFRLDHARTQYSMEILEEYGEHEEAQRQRAASSDLAHRIRDQERHLARLERILAIYRQKLASLTGERPEKPSTAAADN